MEEGYQDAGQEPYDQYQDGQGEPANTYNVYVGGLANEVTEKDLVDAFLGMRAE